MGKDLELRRVSPFDSQVSAFIDLLDQYQSDLYPAESNHLDSRSTLSEPTCCLLGAYKENQLVGIAAAKVVNGYGELKRFYIPESQRGQGIAESLLKALELWLLENGIRKSCLETGIHQHAALRFYEKLGYTTCGPFGDYKEDPLSVFMSKNLMGSTQDSSIAAQGT